VKVTLIAETVFHPDTIEGIEWKPEDNTGQDLIEFAGRACYQSWSRPNPRTATNAGYLEHIIDVNHGSVLEHGTVSFYIEGVSRSLTHELVRHRHLSFSQLSQRYVTPHPDVPFVIPPLLQADPDAYRVMWEVWQQAVNAYGQLIEIGNRIVGDNPNVFHSSAAKVVREAARAVLPNMTPTSIVVSGNHRSWREFIEKRATLQADAEICELAVEVAKILMRTVPNVYQDFQIFNTGDRLWIDHTSEYKHER